MIAALAGHLLLASKQLRLLDYVAHAWLLLTDFDGKVAFYNRRAKDQSCWAKVFGLPGGDSCGTFVAVEFVGNSLLALAPTPADSIAPLVPAPVS